LAWRAERLATKADDRSSMLFESLGEMARKFTEEQGRRFDEVTGSIKGVNRRFDVLELQLKDGIKPQLDAASKNAEEARTSSHDLSADIEKMEGILAEVKAKAVDSVRVKALVVEEHQVLVTKDRLAELEEREVERNELKKTQATEKRNYKLTVRALVVSGIVVAIVTGAITYLATRPPTPAQDSSQHH